MSRKRSLSLERALGQKQISPIYDSGGYISATSPNRSPQRTSEALRCVPTTPELLRNYQGPTEFPQEPFKPPRTFEYGCEDLEESFNLEPRESNRESLQTEDIPEDLLDEYVEPSFYEPPANLTYDELMCVLASPPPPLQQANHMQELSEMVIPDPLRTSDHRVESKVDGPPCTFEMEPLPFDPEVIPPPPKDSNDVVAIIRRARAIQRLRALEEAEAARNVPNTLKQLGRTRKLRPSAKTPLQIRKMVPQTDKLAVRQKEYPIYNDHPTDYDEAILHARKLAGIKTRNTNLLQNYRCPSSSPHRRSPSPPCAASPTYASIVKRAAAIRAKTDAAKLGQPSESKKPLLTPQLKSQENSANLSDQLDEFEALEELYNARPDQCKDVPREQNETVLANRIQDLQRQLLESPAQHACTSPNLKVPPIIRYYDFLKRHEKMLTAGHVPEHKDNLQDIQGIADWELAEFSANSVCPSPCYSPIGATVRIASPQSSPTFLPVSSSFFDDEFLKNVDGPDFGSSDEPDCDFSAMADDAVALADISMPSDVFELDTTLGEMGLDDITFPEPDDHTIELSDYESAENAQVVEEEEQKSTGFVSSAVSAVVDKFRNMFGGSPKEREEDAQSLDMDSSLPNLFKGTPPPRPATPPPEKSTSQASAYKSPSQDIPIVIPPHPKDPRDHAAIVKRAQLIQKLKAREVAENLPPVIPVTKSSISKSVPTIRKPSAKKTKPEQPPNKYPPGGYSPSYVAAVARARVLAGYKNRSAVLNPQRAAKIAALKAERVATEESLPPVERIQKRIARIVEKRGKLICPRPSIENLGVLEAIRESLPKTELAASSKPAVRRRVINRNHSFSKKFERAFGKIKPMTPIKEESYDEKDLMRFSPLRPHEGRLRLQHLQNLEQKHSEREVSPQMPQTTSASIPEMCPVQYSPIRLLSPSHPRIVERGKETITTKLVENSGEESIRQEIVEKSTMDDGEVYTTTRKFTTKTDPFGKVTCQLEESRGPIGAEETIVENIDTIEAPEFFDTYDIPSPKESSMPSPSEIIDNIRAQVQRKLDLVLLEVPSTPEEPTMLKFPKELPDEQLFDVDIPELEMTLPEIEQLAGQPSPNVSLPFCWGEIPTNRQPSPTKVTSPAAQQNDASCAPTTELHDRQIVIPPHPKDPKDYASMVKRAQAIQKLSRQVLEKDEMAQSRLVGPISKDQKKTSRIKKSMKSEQKFKEVGECPAEPPPIPAEYAAAVARARQLAGYKNRSVALNPGVAENLSSKPIDKEDELSASEALPAYQQIMKRMERMRCLRAHMDPSQTVISSSVAQDRRQTSTQPTSIRSSPARGKELKDLPNKSLEEFKKIEQQIAKAQEVKAPDGSPCPRSDSIADISLEEFEALERQAMIADWPNVISPTNASLDEFEALERQTAAAADSCYLRERSLDKRSADFEMKLHGPIETPKCPIGSVRPRNIMNELNLPHSRELPHNCVSPKEFMEQQDLIDNQNLYEKLISDFHTKRDELQTVDQNVLDDLMPSTPVCPQERLRQIKETQQGLCLPRNIDMYEDEYDTPPNVYSPIPLLSPTSEAPISDAARDATPLKVANDDVLVDLRTPTNQYNRPKQFRDLEDMPFDELMFEDEPTLTLVSFETPTTPPPQPSEIINRIREQVRKRLGENKSDQCQLRSPCELPFQHDHSEEDLFELSVPSLIQSPVTETFERQNTASTAQTCAFEDVATPTPYVASHPPTPSRTSIAAIAECSKLPSPKGPIRIPPHPKNPKDYAAMVKRSQAIHKLRQQVEAENATSVRAPDPLKKKAQIGVKPSLKVFKDKAKAKPAMRRITTKAKEQKPALADEQIMDPAEPPPLSANYVKAVARARQLAGYKNRTAALNPAIAAKISRKKTEAEAEAAAFADLPAHEKLKVRMERLRSKLKRDSGVKPTMEQFAFLQHMKEVCERTPSPKPHEPTQREMTSYSPQRLSMTPRPTQTARMDESSDLAQFEALEQMMATAPQVCEAMPQKGIADGQRMANQQQIAASELGDASLVEFEALEAAHDQCLPQPPVASLQLSQIIAEMQQQQLATPPQVDAQERYKQLLTRMRSSPKTLEPPSPVKTPVIHYSPIALPLSPTSTEESKRLEQSTTQMANARTDPSANITCQINDSKLEQAINMEQLQDIAEPSFLDMTPITPTGAPRPRDVINRIQKDIKCRPRPEIPTGRLIELRTPPRELPLPQHLTEEELLEMTCPALPKTPPRTPKRSPTRSPEQATNISIPEMFIETPLPPTPPLPSVSPHRHRVASREGPIVIPAHPKDPTDYAAMVRRARKIQQLQKQEEADARSALLEANKHKKTERVPISKWTAPPRKKTTTRKNMIMKNGETVPETLSECPTEPPPLPEGYAEQVARARRLAGLKNKTTALNAKGTSLVQKTEGDKNAAVNALPTTAGDFETLMSRITAIKEQGYVPQAQPSMATAAYVGAMKSIMENIKPTLSEDIETEPGKPAESPETRYRQLKNVMLCSPPPDEYSPLQRSPCDEIPYTPIRLDDDFADTAAGKAYFDLAKFEGLQDLGELDEFEEPSIMSVTQPPSPRTPQPTPSRLISRIREQVKQKLADDNLMHPTPTRTPIATLNLPENVSGEDLFELSVPSFVKTPQTQPKPAISPNISIPRYFEATPSPPKLLPTAKTESPHRAEVALSNTVLAKEASSSSILGVCPGLRVETPEGPTVVPPHPKDPADVVAMIQRAQLIQKLKIKHEAEESKAKHAALKLARGARVPISRRPRGPPSKNAVKPPQLLKQLFKPGGKAEKNSKNKEGGVSPECAAGTLQLSPDYIAAIARARTMAGLKNTSGLLNPSKPPQDYASIRARAAAMKAQLGQIEPTARELATAQNIINRRQKVERERQLCKLEQRRKEHGDDFNLDFGQLLTPPPALERFRALRSRISSETNTSLRVPYSPVKTPDSVELPAYEPIHLAPSPPCPFLQNISEPDIGDVSMPIEFHYDHGTGVNNVGPNNDFQQQSFDLSRRIQFLQNQCLQTPRQISISPRAKCLLPTSLESPGLAEFEELEQRGEVFQHPSDTVPQIIDSKQVADDLNRLAQKSRAQQRLLCEDSLEERPLPRMDHLRGTTQQKTERWPRKPPVSGEFSALDSFEAMENLCRTPHER